MTAHARTTDPVTSHQAAKSVDLGHQQAEALHALHRAAARHNGANVSQIWINYAGRRPERSVLARRITDLVQHGLAVDTGRTRMAPTGRSQTVWALTPTGITEATR